MPFATKFTLEQRLSESERIRSKYPDRVPCIIERSAVSNKSIPDIDRHKFLVPQDLAMSAVMQIIRRRMGVKLKAEESLYMFIRTSDGKKSIIAPMNKTMSSIDAHHKFPDGFVYIEYAGESTFG